MNIINLICVTILVTLLLEFILEHMCHQEDFFDFYSKRFYCALFAIMCNILVIFYHGEDTTFWVVVLGIFLIPLLLQRDYKNIIPKLILVILGVVCSKVYNIAVEHKWI